MQPKTKTYSLGVDIGATKMLAILMDSDGKIVARTRKKTKSHEGPTAVYERLCTVLRQTVEEGQVLWDSVKSIGIGVPAPVDMEAGIVIHAMNIGWKHFPLRAKLRKRFRSNIQLLNDVDAGLYGEYLFGAAKGSRTAIGIFPGTGVGGACILEGQIVRGKRTSAFEIGHIPVQPNGPLCACGRRGCLEAIAGRLAIASKAAAFAYRGAAPKLINAAGLDVSQYGSSVLSEAVSAGDQVIEELITESAEWVGTAAATVVNLLAPDCIVLGGGLVEAMPDLYLRGVEKKLREQALPSFMDNLRVVPAKLGDDAAAKGAAAWANRQCVKVP